MALSTDLSAMWPGLCGPSTDDVCGGDGLLRLDDALPAGRTGALAPVHPAGALTAILWGGLGLFSSLYFSSVIIDDSKRYGTVGAIFTFLTWFILTGGVVVLGAACGAVW